MEKFLEILTEYKAEIASVVLFILGVITLIVKRRPKSVDEVLSILYGVGSQVSAFVSAVEVPGEGSWKKEQVISMCLLEVRKRLKRPLSQQEMTDFSEYFGSLVESVLEAPQKKGVNQ